MRNRKGKWIVRDLNIRWFCRNCEQHGVIGITVLDSDKQPEVDDVVRMICAAVHKPCDNADIRTFYDATKLRK